MKALFWLAITLLLITAARASEHSVRFTILSYNIHGLPPVIAPNSDRFAEIGEILKERRAAGTAPQVVFLQESFIGKTAQLNEIAGYPNLVYGPKAGGKFFGSGLRVLSEYPILDRKIVTYDGYCGTWDCYANKGAVVVSLHLPGVPFEVRLFNTHMQSGKNYEKERVIQQRILWKFVRDHEDGLPFIVGGDFNISPERESYAAWAKLTGLTNLGEYCLDAQGGCEILNGTDPITLDKKSHDHMYFLPGAQPSHIAGVKSYSIRPVSIWRPFKESVNGHPLSDHLGYEATFELSWQD